MSAQLIPDMETRDDYHADKSRISKSGLDLIHKSPLHYWAKHLDPNREPDKPKKHYVIGSITNDVLLQQHLIDKLYVVVPKSAPKRPTVTQLNAAKPSPETIKAIAFWEQFEAANVGKTIITADEYDAACRMRDAVWSHKAASLLLRDGVAEQTILFEDIETGAACKCKPDWQSHLGKGFLCDLKTTTDASPDGFGRSAASYRYHVQGAFYSHGVYYATDKFPEAFIFIAVEKEPPYAVACYSMNELQLEAGHDAYLKDLQLYVECKAANKWPGYPQTVEPLKLPNYIFKQL